MSKENMLDGIYELGKSKAMAKDLEMHHVADTSEAVGAIKALSYMGAQSELAKYVVLYRLKKMSKKERGGLTFEDICGIIKEPRRTADEKINEIVPMLDKASADFAEFTKIPFPKIRRLGRSITAGSAEIDDGNLIIGGLRIPFTPENQDKIESAIDDLIESQRQEKEALQKKLKNQEKNFERNVAERTKELAAELEDTKAAKDHFKDEVERLKPYDIEQKEITEAAELIKELGHYCGKIEIAIRKFRKFIPDNRLKEDMKVFAEISQFILWTYDSIKQLRIDWDDEFYPEIDD